MNENVSKTNEDLDFFYRRLDEICMSSHERLEAKALFAQAEVVADILFTAAQGIARLFKRWTVKPAHPGTPAAPSAG